jgi:hypothetical protein
MDRYYYFVSELPFLQFGQKPPISRSYFLEEAKKWLGSKELISLSRLRLDDFSQVPQEAAVIGEYKIFERNLRQELAALRGGKKPDADYRLAASLEAIVASGNPLDVEIELLRVRWDFLDEREKGHVFDFDFLVIYYLRLQILERLFIFDKDKGTQRFDELTAVSL